jgi:hypothetical protein
MNNVTDEVIESQEYEEIIIPAPAAVPFRGDEELMPIRSMDAWGQRTFHVRLPSFPRTWS